MSIYLDVSSVFIWSIVSGVFALVPIPLEPQVPCFTHFGECIRYCPGERIPDLEEIESSCITNTAGYQFCKFYHCPPSDCRHRKKDMYGKCYYCPGHCIDGGKTHRNGQAFLSFDRVNSCFCGQDNSKHCTKHPVDQYAYCNHARPGGDGGNEVVVVERPPAPAPPRPQIVAYVPPPPQTAPPQTVAYVPAPTNPPVQPAVAYVPPPTNPPMQHVVAYVPAPTQTPYQPDVAYVPPPPTPQAYVPPPPPEHQQPNVVPHPNFSAKSPKTNLQQRTNSHPQPQTQVYNQQQSYGYPHYPNNPFYGQFPWGFNPFNKEGELSEGK